MENTDKTQTGGAGAQNTENKPNNQPNAGSAAGKTQGEGQKGQSGGQPGGAGADSPLAEQVGNIVRGDTGAVKDVLNQAKESTGAVASQAYGFATQKATTVIDEQKTNLTHGLSSVADSIRQVGETLRSGDQPTGVANTAAQYSDTIADKVEQITGYLDRRDLNGLVRDVKSLAQSNPALFLGGAFTLGILAARFIKSGNSNQSLMVRAQNLIGNTNQPRNTADQVRNTQNTQVKPLIRKDSNTGGVQTGGGASSSGIASQNKGG
ncbi:MAG TPA: hypothetical protein VNI84_14795 [Pyrinomonadaceae bacterium]|nr:hypothetical protein [Pyrinomonadaceae bacterium]